MIKKVSGIAFSNILYSAFSFLFISLIINYLSKEDYAIISILIVYSQFITLFVNFSLDNGLLRFYNETPLKSQLVSTVIIFSLLSFLFISIIFYLIIGESLNSIFIHKINIFFVLILSLYTVLINIIKSIYLAEQNVFNYTIFIVSSVFLPYCLSYISLLIFSNSVQNFVLGYSIGIILLLFATLISYRHYFGFKYIVFKKELITEPIKFSVLILPGLLSSWIISSVDKIYLSSINEPILVADINVVNKITSLAILPSLALVSAFYPHFLKLKRSLVNDVEMQDRVFFIVLFITLGFVLFTFFCSDILQLLFPAYSNAIFLIYFYNVSGYITVVTGFLNFEYYHLKKTGKVSLFITLTAIFNISLIYLLIPYFGAKIVGFISLLSSFFNFLLLCIYIPNSSKYIKIIKNHILVFIFLLLGLNYLSYNLLIAQRICSFVFVILLFWVFYKKDILSWRRYL